jgi:hypothetical protein
MTKFPAADHRRCDALTDPRFGSPNYRCTFAGHYFRDGRWVCWAHREVLAVRYACGNRFEVFAEVMERALEPAP